MDLTIQLFLILEGFTARFRAKGLQNLSQGTKTGEGRLKQVGADEGSE